MYQYLSHTSIFYTCRFYAFLGSLIVNSADVLMPVASKKRAGIFKYNIGLLVPFEGFYMRVCIEPSICFARYLFRFEHNVFTAQSTMFTHQLNSPHLAQYESCVLTDFLICDSINYGVHLFRASAEIIKRFSYDFQIVLPIEPEDYKNIR